MRKEEKKGSEASPVQADGSADNLRKVGTLPRPAWLKRSKEGTEGGRVAPGGSGPVVKNPNQTEPRFWASDYSGCRPGHSQSPNWKWTRVCFIL